MAVDVALLAEVCPQRNDICLIQCVEQRHIVGAQRAVLAGIPSRERVRRAIVSSELRLESLRAADLHPGHPSGHLDEGQPGHGAQLQNGKDAEPDDETFVLHPEGREERHGEGMRAHDLPVSNARQGS